MRVLKKILIALGSVFVLLIIGFAWLGFQSARFKRAETPFVTTYVTDLSRRWNVADVYDRSANEFLAQADTAEGRRAIEMFRPLGALTSSGDLDLKNYSVGTWGRRGVFDFKARFQNGEAVVEVTIVDSGRGGARVLGVHLDAIKMNLGASGKMST
jgi:hypothetical protein